MKQRFNFHEVISLLKKSGIISKVEIKSVDEIIGKGVYKVRCNLIPSKFKFEIRYIQIEEQTLYSYQLFSKAPIIRWDNAPHYPKIKTYPHHFHTMDGYVVNSNLTGNVIEDLKIVLSNIKMAIIKYR